MRDLLETKKGKQETPEKEEAPTCCWRLVEFSFRLWVADFTEWQTVVWLRSMAALSGAILRL